MQNISIKIAPFPKQTENHYREKWQLDSHFCFELVVICVLIKVCEERRSRKDFQKIGKGRKKEVIVGFIL